MGSEKRGLHKKEDKNFFRSKLVLDSMKSKVVFAFIVLMFGVVIVLGVTDVYDGLKIRQI